LGLPERGLKWLGAGERLVAAQSLRAGRPLARAGVRSCRVAALGAADADRSAAAISILATMTAVMWYTPSRSVRTDFGAWRSASRCEHR
jgi:hypothetical protein